MWEIVREEKRIWNYLLKWKASSCIKLFFIYLFIFRKIIRVYSLPLVKHKLSNGHETESPLSSLHSPGNHPGCLRFPQLLMWLWCSFSSSRRPTRIWHLAKHFCNTWWEFKNGKKQPYLRKWQGKKRTPQTIYQLPNPTSSSLAFPLLLKVALVSTLATESGWGKKQKDNTEI